jgi:hypothetical protein
MIYNWTSIVDLLIYLNLLNFDYNRAKHFKIEVEEEFFKKQDNKKLKITVVTKEEGRRDFSILPISPPTCFVEFKLCLEDSRNVVLWEHVQRNVVLSSVIIMRSWCVLHKLGEL